MTDGREIADFNDAIGKLNRINQLFLKALVSSGQLDVFGWFHALSGVHRELYSYAKTDKERGELEDIRLKTAGEVNKHVSNPRLVYSGRVSPELYNNLHAYEIKLRQIYKDCGLEMKFKDDPRSVAR